MRFAHRHEHALQALTRILNKREQLLAVGVSRISRKRLPLRVDADVLAVYFDAFLAVLNTPPERARHLIAHEENSRVFIAKIVLLMRAIAPAVRHPRPRDDNFWIWRSVDGAGFCHPSCQFQTPEQKRVGILFEMLLRSGIEQAPVFSEYVGHLYGERRIEIYRDRRKRSFFYHHIELKKEQLGTFEGE